jgi:hypothetical protein
MVVVVTVAVAVIMPMAVPIIIPIVPPHMAVAVTMAVTMIVMAGHRRRGLHRSECQHCGGKSERHKNFLQHGYLLCGFNTVAPLLAAQSRHSQATISMHTLTAG